MIIYDEPNEVYHANAAISSSQAKLYATDPMLLRDSLDGLMPRKSSAAMDLGTVVHQRVLEPDAEPCWRVKPSGIDMRTKAGKEWRAGVPDGALVLDQDDADRINRMIDRMPDAVADLLESAPVREATVRVDAGPIQIQARPDAWDGPEVSSLIVDLKTCADLSRIRWAIRDFGYALSAGWYTSVLARETGVDWLPDWCWVFAETNPPHRWQIVTMHRQWLQDSRDEAELLIHRIGESFATNTWTHQHPVSITMDRA